MAMTSLKRYAPGTDVGLALGIFCLLSLLILPLPTILLDFGLSLSVTAAVLVLMVALFLEKPLDFTSFPQLLLLTTLLRLSLNVATTRLILSHGNEGPTAAGHVVAAFGGFLMGGDVVIGLILFAILLVVNFMVITKLRPYCRSRGAVQPGCHAGQADGHRRRSQRRPDQ
jgi:flagellar biosynthesis protein FlhA